MNERDMFGDEYRFDRVRPSVPPIDPWVALAWLGVIVSGIAFLAFICALIYHAARIVWRLL